MCALSGIEAFATFILAASIKEPVYQGALSIAFYAGAAVLVTTDCTVAVALLCGESNKNETKVSKELIFAGKNV